MQVQFRIEKFTTTIAEKMGLRFALSRDVGEEVSPSYFEMDVCPGNYDFEWSKATITQDTHLLIEAFVMRQDPDDPFSLLEKIPSGGATVLLAKISQRRTIKLVDVYSDPKAVIGELTFQGIVRPRPRLPSLSSSSPAISSVATRNVLRRFDAYYRTASPAQDRDRYMHVREFTFPGGSVPAALVVDMKATQPMNDEFVSSLLRVVLENAGWGWEEFGDALRDQRRTGKIDPALAARLGEFVTTSANLLAYRSDLDAKTGKKLVERFLPHCREYSGADCEDSALEARITFLDLQGKTWSTLRATESDEGVVEEFREFAKLYEHVVVSSAAENDQGDLLHIYGLAIPRFEMARLLDEEEKDEWKEWERNLLVIGPVEGTNWADPLMLPEHGDWKARERERKDRALAKRISSRTATWPITIRQSKSATLTNEEFSGFYKEVTEFWVDRLDEEGKCCYSVVKDGVYGVPLPDLLIKDARAHLVPVYVLEEEELAHFRRVMRLTMPIPPYIGEMRPFEIEALDRVRTTRIVPRRISQLTADTLVYRFRSVPVAEANEGELAKLQDEFDVDYRAYAFPPRGEKKYVVVYLRRKE